MVWIALIRGLILWRIARIVVALIGRLILWRISCKGEYELLLFKLKMVVNAQSYQDSVDKAFAAVAESVDLDSAEADRAVHFVLAAVVAVAELVSLDRQLVVASIVDLELTFAVDRADVELD